jgi:hypothetical protein
MNNKFDIWWLIEKLNALPHRMIRIDLGFKHLIWIFGSANARVRYRYGGHHEKFADLHSLS